MKRCCCLLLLTCVGVGCFGSSKPVSSPPPATGPSVTTQDAFKTRIKFISENGGMGSAFAGIVDMAEKNGDAGLIASAKELEKAKSPEQAKSIAKKMLEKLN